jgi:hypothetical protein
MSVYLSLKPFVETLRVYDEPDGYEKRIPYKGILTITHINDRTIYVSGAVGEVDRRAWNEALKLFRERGITTMMYERHGVMKTREI